MEYSFSLKLRCIKFQMSITDLTIKLIKKFIKMKAVPIFYKIDN